MREQFKRIRESDVEACIPADVLGQIETEACRLTDVLAGLISYSDEIRMEDGEGSRRSLQAIESDAEALAIFQYQLEADPVSGFLNGTKVRQGKSADTLLGSLRKKLRLRISGQTLRTIGARIADRLQEDLQPERGGMRRGRRPEPVLVGSIKALPDSYGRAAVISATALRVGQNTRLLHACAAKYQLEAAEAMLNRYDSIHDVARSHVPDLFHDARKIRRHFTIHVGDTNTGKTHDAMKALANAPSGVYLAPLRMLAYEGRAVIEEYGVPCSFATGEEKEIKPEASHISETIGMLDFRHRYDMAVIDECQLISGEDGSLYTNAILGVNAPFVEVCCAYSGLEITKKLITLCGDTYEVIEHTRTSELKFEEEPYRGPRKNDAYIVFSRLGAYEMAAWLQKKGMNPSIVYGKLPYEVKMEEARKFECGDTDCLVATDAIAIGQNYNIERIVFRDTVKHINRREVELDSQTVKQVAGRAGRYGRFPVGYVNTFDAADRAEIRQKLEEKDIPSAAAPLELPSFLVDVDLPLSLIYKAWNEAKAGEPFVKADTSTELYICRLIESRYRRIGKRDEYSLAALPLDLRDRDQEGLLDNLLYLYDKGNGTDEEWKLLLPDKEQIGKIVRYRPHMMTMEKLCRQLDLASSFFYKIRRDDLASYVIRLKPPITKRIAELMAEKPENQTEESGNRTGKQVQPAFQERLADWTLAYIYVSVSGQTERNTGRFPYGDYRRLFSRELQQSFGNEATYIDYYCYKRKTRTPDYCRFEPYFRYTVKLDPKYIVSDEGAYYLAEHFQIVRCDYQHSASPMQIRGKHKAGR
jgi:ATP-dependent RNA helicase SUPV3L1/SUV3